MAESRKTGAGSMLSGVLERTPQREKPEAAEPEASPEAGSKGRGVAPAPKPARAPVARTAKRIKGRTVYIPDELFERIIVQAHRRDVTISDYVTLLLERHVPDHRVVRSGPSVAQAAEQSEDQDAA